MKECQKHSATTLLDTEGRKNEGAWRGGVDGCQSRGLVWWIWASLDYNIHVPGRRAPRIYHSIASSKRVGGKI